MINYKKKESRLSFWRFTRNTENKSELRTGTDKCKKFCIQYGYSMVNTDFFFFFFCFSGVFVVVIFVYLIFFFLSESFSAIWSVPSAPLFYCQEKKILLSGTNPVHITQKHSVGQVSH